MRSSEGTCAALKPARLSPWSMPQLGPYFAFKSIERRPVLARRFEQPLVALAPGRETVSVGDRAKMLFASVDHFGDRWWPLATALDARARVRDELDRIDRVLLQHHANVGVEAFRVTELIEAIRREQDLHPLQDDQLLEVLHVPLRLRRRGLH